NKGIFPNGEQGGGALSAAVGAAESASAAESARRGVRGCGGSWNTRRKENARKGDAFLAVN
ncbi:MAG: hypothetical protein IJ191_02235, partial [Treponema sp.]|nr:hypothetical protein [Treponema sp.]